tara:strand:- start:3221 stop:5152 length:1932 start_codon:yes stop_codon:yes gene_type:complete
MQLLYPYFLVFGLVLVIPILIHLFNLRKFKIVYYSDITLLEQIVLKTKRNKSLKSILVLSVRLLLLSILILSFCYPYIEEIFPPVNEGRLIYIDNSKSSEIDIEGESVFNKIKETNYVIDPLVSGYNFLSNSVKVFNTLTSDEVFELVSTSTITTQEIPIRGIIDLLSFNDKVTSLVLFSPFAKSFNLEGIEQVKQDLTLVHFDVNNANVIQIDTVWTEEVVESEEGLKSVFVEFKCFGSKSVYDFKLFVNDELRGTESVNTQEGLVRFKTHFTEHINKSVVKCYDEGGIQVRSFYFVIRNKKKHNICLIGINTNSPLSKAFSNKKDFSLNQFTLFQIDYDVLFKADLVYIKYDNSNKEKYKYIIDQCLKKDVKVCLCLNDKIDDNVLREFEIKVNSISDTVGVNILYPNSNLYNGVFLDNKKSLIGLPTVSREFSFSGLINPLLNNEYNEAVLIQSIVQPNLYVSTIDFSEASSFTNHSIFIPTVYQFLFYDNVDVNLYSRPNQYFQFTGIDKLLGKVFLRQFNDSLLIEIESITQGEVNLVLLDNELKSGWYELETDSIGYLLAINEDYHLGQYDYRSIAELEALVSSTENIKVISSMDFINDNKNRLFVQVEYPLWKYLILFAIVLLIIEMLFLKIKFTE